MKVLVTINYINDFGIEHEIDVDMEAIDLNAIYEIIKYEYPTFTSAVVVFSKREND